MLGRKRPASRILLWPRSNTRAVRFTTTAPTDSHNEATAEYEHEDDSADVLRSVPEKRRFKHIRKLIPGLYDAEADNYIIRRVTSNTAPVGPVDPWAKVGKISLPDSSSDGSKKQNGLPTTKLGAGDDSKSVERQSSPFERPAQRLSRQATVSGKWGQGNSVQVDLVRGGQWKPFSPNPDFVADKPASLEHAADPTPPSKSPLQKNRFKEAGKIELSDDAPPRSRIMEEMKAWNLETVTTTRTEQATQVSQTLTEEPDIPHVEDGPSRSKIIEEMMAWNYEAPAKGIKEETHIAEKQDVAARAPARARGVTPKEELPPLDRSFRKWLKWAIKDAVRKAEQNRHLTKDVAVYDGPTVVVLNGASRSLLESDFYRLAPQGQHLDDWAVGIARIIQARDPTTYEPLGKYYIFFNTRAAAMAYSEEVWRLHRLSRRAAQLISTCLPSSSDISVPGPLPLAPTLAAESADLDAALRGYTLLPHSAMLDLKLHLCKDLALPAVDKLSSMNRYLNSSPKIALPQDHYFVLVNLEGCKTTIAALRDTIARDGEERRCPWALATPGHGKASIAAVLPDHGPDAKTSGFHAEDKRFARFIVPFTEAAEARRFVRNWHRREVPDLEGRNMVATFNVTALW
jgi:hypothetical protein